MELFLLPLMFIAILLASLWFNDTRHRPKETYAKQKVASPPPPMR
ncbi:MAG TPA: hypothetical protein VL485_31595 [Ktedonobacteraceae bacterium]|jgi:hypothetical protein|nr:hypothetical protein [Ktedonobacteraceae bacterium]